MPNRNPSTTVPVLTIGNVLSAAFGVLTGLVVARQLGPEKLALVGVLGAILSVAANVLDIRMGDLLSRLMYNVPPGTPDRLRSILSIVRAGLMLHLMLSLGIGLLGFAAAWTLLHLFIDQTATAFVLVAFATAETLSAFGNVVGFLQRFARRAFAMASVQVGIAAARALIICLAVLHESTVTSYAVAVVIASALSAAVNSLFLLSLALRRAPFAEIVKLEISSIARFAGELRFAAFANLSGYAKLLHRSIDVLVVGYLCSDRETGLYKFARSLTDALYILYDAMNKAFQVDLLEWIGRGAGMTYRLFARRLLFMSVFATAILLGVEMWFLPTAVEAVVGDRYLAAVPAILWLSVPVVFVFGVQLWLWPILVYHGRLHAYAGLQIVGVAVFQYGLPLAAMGVTGGASAWLFALGYACSYAAVYVPLYLLERNATPRFFPM